MVEISSSPRRFSIPSLGGDARAGTGGGREGEGQPLSCVSVSVKLHITGPDILIFLCYLLRVDPTHIYGCCVITTACGLCLCERVCED